MMRPAKRKSRLGADRFWTLVEKTRFEIVEGAERKRITLIKAKSSDDQIGIFRLQEWQKLPRVGVDV